MSILYQEALEQIPKCLYDFEETRKRGYGSGIESLKLAIKYETFLNSIYSLCENLSMIVHYLYDKKVRQGFREQKERFLKNTTLDPDYSKILKNTSWYDEVNGMRNQATHYLSGMITISSATELGYFNVPKSGRKVAPKSISIDDIEKHVKQTYNDVLDFLALFGDHFITIINQDSYVVLLCLVSSGLLGAKKISLREYLNNESGICHTIDFDCPRKDSCQARRKAES